MSLRRLTNNNFKTEAEIVADGGTVADLLHDTKVYVTANGINKSLDQAVVDGDLGGNAPAVFENHIINGAMEFAQRQSAAEFTYNTNSTVNAYDLDRFSIKLEGVTNKNVTISRIGDGPVPQSHGYSFSRRFLVNTAIPTLDPTDRISPLVYKMECGDFDKIIGKEVTIGFWFKSTSSGLFNMSLQTVANKSYLTTFNYTTSGVFQYITKTLTIDNSTGFSFSHQTGMILEIGTLGGSNFSGGAVNVWSTGSPNTFKVAPGTVNWATSGGYISVSNLQMCKTNTLDPLTYTRAGITYGGELALCQRYFEKSGHLNEGLTGTNQAYMHNVTANGINTVSVSGSFRVSKRHPPEITLYSPVTGAADNIRNASNNTDLPAVVVTSITHSGFATNINTATANHIYIYNWSADSELY